MKSLKQGHTDSVLEKYFKKSLKFTRPCLYKPCIMFPNGRGGGHAAFGADPIGMGVGVGVCVGVTLSCLHNIL